MAQYIGLCLNNGADSSSVDDSVRAGEGDPVVRRVVIVHLTHLAEGDLVKQRGQAPPVPLFQRIDGHFQSDVLSLVLPEGLLAPDRRGGFEWLLHFLHLDGHRGGGLPVGPLPLQLPTGLPVKTGFV